MEYIQILILKNNKETINLLDMYCYGSLDYNNYTNLAQENLEKRINITSIVYLIIIGSHTLFQMNLRTTLLFS